MELPKFNETFVPILETLRDGRIVKSRDLIELVEKNYYSTLPSELLNQLTKSGERLIENRIAWGKSYLKKGGLVHYPERGSVQITEKGKAANTSTLSIADMHGDVLSFYEPESEKVTTPAISSSTPQDLIDQGFKIIEGDIKSELLARLKETDAYYFEKIILILLKKMGYGDFIETSKSRDGGIDGIINEDQLGLEKIYIQAKRYTENKVREPEIRNFIGAMSGDTTKGIFVTTSDFDEHAKKKASDANHKIILINGEKLVSLMFQFNVGVQIKNTYEVKIVDYEFFNSEEL